MKVRLPKSFFDLPESEKKAIEDWKTEEVKRILNENYAYLQKVWLQLSCIVMAQRLNMSSDECLLYLANFKEIYRLNSQLHGEEEQAKWLSEKMDEIFGKGNYPYKYIDKLEEM